jgi:hypothetical protein
MVFIVHNFQLANTLIGLADVGGHAVEEDERSSLSANQQGYIAIGSSTSSTLNIYLIRFIIDLFEWWYDIVILICSRRPHLKAETILMGNKNHLTI